MRRLIAVWAADSGAVALAIDAAKKLLRVPGCTLCDLTHGVTGERASWRRCKEGLPVPVDAYHRDELPPALAAHVAGRWPQLVLEEGGRFVTLLGPAELGALAGPDALEPALRAALAQAGSSRRQRLAGAPAEE